MTEILTFELVHYDRPWTLNDERGGKRSKGHWGWLSERKAEWRGIFRLLARHAKIPPLKTISVEAIQVCPTNTMPDTGSCYGAVKAAIDGLVDAKVIPNDTRHYVANINLMAPEKGTKDALILRVTGARA